MNCQQKVINIYVSNFVNFVIDRMKTICTFVVLAMQPITKLSKMIEIEIHQTKAEGRRVYVDYTIYEGETVTNVTQELKMFDLIEFVKSKGFNLAYLNAPDELTELDPATYLFENLDSVVKLYIESKFEEVSKCFA